MCEHGRIAAFSTRPSERGSPSGSLQTEQSCTESISTNLGSMIIGKRFVAEPGSVIADKK